MRTVCKKMCHLMALVFVPLALLSNGDYFWSKLYNLYEKCLEEYYQKRIQKIENKNQHKNANNQHNLLLYKRIFELCSKAIFVRFKTICELVI